MPSIFKSGSSAGRPKSHKPIRGTISAPIPISSSLDDDEFPQRIPGSGIASTTNDDEFPIRNPGTGIASPVPPEDAETSDATPEQQPATPQPPLIPQAQAQAQAQPQTQAPVQQQQPSLASPSVVVSGSGLRVADGVQDFSPEESSDTSIATPALIPALAPVAVAVAGFVSVPTPPVPRSPAAQTPSQRSSPQRITSAKPTPHTPQREPIISRNSAFPIRQANAAAGNVRYSTVSDAPSGFTSQSKDAPQRKKSTLRSALGKIFGRKKKNGGSQNVSPTDAIVESGARMSGVAAQHRSEPPVPSNRDKEDSPKRSASVPITEYDRPLRSHSVGPDDIMAIDNVRNSYQGDAATPGRRAATTSSRHFTTRRRDPEWGGGLSPRPVSSHARGDKVSTGDEDPSEIGRAITSDSNNGQFHRRSRSLSGIGDIVSGRPGVRRRSDEIRYWRESYDPGFLSPPLSSNDADGEHRHRDVDARDGGTLDSSAAQHVPKTPPQPFNFGPISSELIGMKITQAASMETRIGTLEARSHRLERVVTQLCHTVPGFKSPLMEVAPGRAGARESTSAYSTNAAPPTVPAIYHASTRSSRRESIDTDQVSFGDAPTYIGSLHPPSSSATQPQSLTVTAPAAPTGIGLLHRPTSTSTVRGASSLPTLGGRDNGSSSGAGDSYATVLAQLDAERAARQALEAQVMKLSDRLNSLSTTMYAMVGGPAKSRSQERLAPPSPHLPGTAKTTDTAVTQPVKQPTLKALKALSVFETDDDDEVKSPATEGDDDEMAEHYQTPREEHTPHPYGAFGEELREDYDDGDDVDDPKRKKAARTLSLSQLTLGKGVRTNI